MIQFCHISNLYPTNPQKPEMNPIGHRTIGNPLDALALKMISRGNIENKFGIFILYLNNLRISSQKGLKFNNI